MRVTIGSRRSDLARIQAYQVGEALKTAHPQIEIKYSFHESLGDRNQNDPLWQMPEKGVFTQDFREGLLRGDFDLVAHSWKDLAIEEDSQTEIAATLPRADARDLLLVRDDRWPAVQRAGVMTILTSSPRRSYNLQSFLREALPAKIGELKFVDVRGNVPTRVRKLLELEVDGLVVAKAAMDRLLEATCDEFAATRQELQLALSQCRWIVLPLRENPAAPAQGALAVEIVRGRNEIRELLAPLNCAGTFAAVTREREILRGYGGGCHQKIGATVLRRDFGDVTFVRGLTDNGEVLNCCSLIPPRPRPPKISREQMWPLNPTESDWFDRQSIPVEPADETHALWIAKADALPDDWCPAREQIVWAGGMQTWKKLARRGVWVHGSAEGLGEQEDEKIETLAGRKLNWLKLTHTRGYDEGAMPVLPTYQLAPNDHAPDLSGRKYFFWRSGSSFERALLLNPWLTSMTHFCGPGNTQGILKKNGLSPFVFLDHGQWLEEMSAALTAEPGR
jgi:hydroxymethylbilane synthase